MDNRPGSRTPMQECKNARLFRHPARSAVLALCMVISAHAQTGPGSPVVNDYVVGPQDILTITSYDQADLSGKFSVEADGTFPYPLICRVRAGGLPLRALE